MAVRINANTCGGILQAAIDSSLRVVFVVVRINANTYGVIDIGINAGVYQVS